MKKIAIIAAFLLLTACQGTLLPPSDGIYGSDLGTTLTLQGGRCVQASVCEAVVSHYGDTPRSWSCSSGIQTSGHAPDYQYSYTSDEVSWIIRAHFQSRTAFIADIHIAAGNTANIHQDVPFTLQSR